MKMCIPSIGDKIRLITDWQLPCFDEKRNRVFIRTFRPDVVLPPPSYEDARQSVVITLPAGTVLRVDRIYIRKGKSEWDSVTFVVAEHPTVKAKGFQGAGRFWAKLVDVNDIEFEPVA
jgi:hypothetical protein